MKKFAKILVRGFLGAAVCAAIAMGAYAYLVVTDFRLALLIKIHTQTFFGHREVRDEMVWVIATETARLNSEIDHCVARPGARACFETLVRQQIAARELTPAGHLLLATQAMALSFNDPPMKSLTEIMNPLSRMWSTVTLVGDLYASSTGSVEVLQKQIQTKFGELSLTQKLVIEKSIKNPVSGVFDRLRSPSNSP